MKILFKNTTKYDKENTDNFLNFHKEKYGKKELIRSIVFLILALYIVIYNVISKNWYMLVGIVIVCNFMYLISTKKEKKNKKQKDKEFTFFFYERYIKIKYKRQFERMTYFELRKIFETDKNFFLYLGEKNSLILDKKGFTIGNSKDFSEFIKRKCKFKYSNKENK